SCQARTVFCALPQETAVTRKPEALPPSIAQACAEAPAGALPPPSFGAAVEPAPSEPSEEDPHPASRAAARTAIASAVASLIGRQRYPLSRAPLSCSACCK